MYLQAIQDTKHFSGATSQTPAKGGTGKANRDGRKGIGGISPPF